MLDLSTTCRTPLLQSDVVETSCFVPIGLGLPLCLCGAAREQQREDQDPANS